MNEHISTVRRSSSGQ